MTIPAPPQAAPTEEVAAPPRRMTGVATLVGLVATLVIALGLVFWFRGEVDQLVGTSAASNDALVDTDTTAQVTEQVTEAVQRVFSYDFARLDADERAAAGVITGPFADKFRRDFARVREMAPEQQAVVVATVPALAVEVLEGDRATVLAFVDQEASTAGQDQPLLAPTRLTITAQLVDGSWKIADVESF